MNNERPYRNTDNNSIEFEIISQREAERILHKRLGIRKSSDERKGTELQKTTLSDEPAKEESPAEAFERAQRIARLQEAGREASESKILQRDHLTKEFFRNGGKIIRENGEIIDHSGDPLTWIRGREAFLIARSVEQSGEDALRRAMASPSAPTRNFNQKDD